MKRGRGGRLRSVGRACAALAFAVAHLSTAPPASGESALAAKIQGLVAEYKEEQQDTNISLPHELVGEASRLIQSRIEATTKGANDLTSAMASELSTVVQTNVDAAKPGRGPRWKAELQGEVSRVVERYRERVKGLDGKVREELNRELSALAVAYVARWKQDAVKRIGRYVGRLKAIVEEETAASKDRVREKIQAAVAEFKARIAAAAVRRK